MCPIVKSKFKKHARSKEIEMIKNLYKTGDYSIRDLMAMFKRSSKFIQQAVHNSIDK